MFKWHDFSKTDWANARYCQECGLPLVKDSNNKYYCLHCNEIEKWRKYSAKLNSDRLHQVEKLESIINKLKDQIKTIQQTQITNEQQQDENTNAWLNPKTNLPNAGEQYLIKALNGQNKIDIYIDAYIGRGYWENTKNVIAYKELD